MTYIPSEDIPETPRWVTDEDQPQGCDLSASPSLSFCVCLVTPHHPHEEKQMEPSLESPILRVCSRYSFASLVHPSSPPTFLPRPTDLLPTFPAHLCAAGGPASPPFPQPGFLSGRVYLYKKC